jgi:dTDP-glucose pyrophosphorylase
MSNNIIKNSATLLDALKRIDSFSHESYTLFVVDSSDKMSGTLTDGDIRRYLVSGGQLQDEISKAMQTEFSFISCDEVNTVAKLREMKSRDITLVPALNQDGQIIYIYDLANYKSHLPIDAVLMAGGKGERLRPLTEKTPKPLIKVGDKCIIDYNIDRLIEFGVTNINVTVNYLKEQIHEHFSHPRNGVNVKTIEEPCFMGTMGSIQFVKDFENDYILVMNSDLFTDINFEDFFLHFQEHDADMSVAAVPYNVSIPFGILNLDGRNIVGLLEKPKYNYYANGGIYLMKKSALDLIPTNEFFNATDLIEKLVASRKKVIRYPLNGTWIDIGQHADLAKAQDLVKHIKYK